MHLLAELCAGWLVCQMLHRVALAKGHAPWDFKGTTPSIEAIFKGRCHEYQEVDEDKRLPELAMNISCDPLWGKLYSSFADRDPCQANRSHYKAYIDYVRANKKWTDWKLVNKAMFWTGTKDVVHDFTAVNHDYVTLEDTFTGYLADGLLWCGCTDASSTCVAGVDFGGCDCVWNGTLRTHWNEVSRLFAESASGIAYVMVNATQNVTANPNATAYYDGGTFGRIELPTLAGKLEELKVLVIYDYDQVPKEKCGTGSLVTLAADCKKYKIPMTCVDNPRVVVPILCVMYPNSDECKRLREMVRSEWKTTGIVMSALAGVFLLAIAVIACSIVRTRSQQLDFRNPHHAGRDGPDEQDRTV